MEIALPKGERPSFVLARHEHSGDCAIAAIIKDAGDDPDVTHHALIVSQVRLLPAGSGLSFVCERMLFANHYRISDHIGVLHSYRIDDPNSLARLPQD